MPAQGTASSRSVSGGCAQIDPHPALDVDTVPQLVRGDYMNLSLTLDLTYSAIDNAFLTGTGFSGALRALEQSFGRDPETMIPDIRYTPNPNDAPGGPLVERGNRQC